MPRRDHASPPTSDHDAYTAPLLADMLELVEDQITNKHTITQDKPTELGFNEDSKHIRDHQLIMPQAPVEIERSDQEPAQTATSCELVSKVASPERSSALLPSSPACNVPALALSLAPARSDTVSTQSFDKRTGSPSPTLSPVLSHAPSKSRRRRLSKLNHIPERASKHTTAHLQVGKRFRGQQICGVNVCEVFVEIKTVDFEQSRLGGYLTINDLVDGLPSMTTYFEGEIIGAKYGFRTKHEKWGTTERLDLQHWTSLAGFAPLAKQGRGLDCVYNDVEQQENIFMRWKESFLVPDYTVKEIMGVSFEGFYYICLNQVTGLVKGVYYHSNCDNWQDLTLTPIHEPGAPPNLDLL